MPQDASPLSPEQRLELRDAKARADSFGGAAKVAAFNGWTIGVFAAVSLLSGFFSLTGFLVGVGWRSWRAMNSSAATAPDRSTRPGSSSSGGTSSA